MNKDKDKVATLVSKIQKHRELYYNGIPEISDSTFDSLWDELKKLDPSNEELKKIGVRPSKSGFPSVRHQIPMGSLDKVTSTEDMRKWIDKVKASGYILQEKLDGLSVALYYDKGNLIQGVTRGDGDSGDLITYNVSKMRNVKKTIPGFTGALRGEIILLKSIFEKHFAGDKVNPRNAAAGIARRKDGEDCEYLSIFYFDIEEESIEGLSNIQKFDRIRSLGLVPVVTFSVLKGYDSIVRLYQQYVSEDRAELDYEIDGMVVKVNDYEDIDRLGYDGKHPNWAVAYKFPNQVKTSTIIDIEWQTTTTGRINPLAVIEPIELMGVTIRRASLANLSLMEEKKIGIGNTVIVTRANDVIPKIEECTEIVSEDRKVPTKCPTCQDPVKRDGRFLLCTNVECPAIKKYAILQWIGTLEIEYFGESLVEALQEAGKLNDPADLYKLTSKDISVLDGKGEGIANRVLPQIESKKSLSLVDFLGALSIKDFGKSRIQSLIDAGYDSLEKIMKISPKEMEMVPGFSSTLSDYFGDRIKKKEPLIQKLLDAGVTIKPMSKGRLTGCGFKFTGSLSVPRKDLEKLVTNNGGQLKWGMPKNYLVTQDPGSSSAKSKEAKSKGIPIISDQEFLRMV